MTDFPDVRWGTERSPLRRPMIWLSCTRLVSRLIKLMVPLDRRILKRSSGRYTVLGPFGAPVLLLTTTGATSGQPRTTPLLYAPDDDALIVVGSNFGAQNHPAWSANLLAHPHATVTMAGKEIAVVAELVQGHDADAGYQRMIEIARTYDEYRSRTGRRIRVFRLTAAP